LVSALANHFGCRWCCTTVHEEPGLPLGGEEPLLYENGEASGLNKKPASIGFVSERTKKLLAPNYWVLTGQSLVQFVHAIYIYSTLTAPTLEGTDAYVQHGEGVAWLQPVNTTLECDSSWCVYQLLVVRSANSGAVTAAVTQLSMMFLGHMADTLFVRDDGDNRTARYAVPFCLLALAGLVLVLCCVFTHVLPMVCAYGWMLAPLPMVPVLFMKAFGVKLIRVPELLSAFVARIATVAIAMLIKHVCTMVCFSILIPHQSLQNNISL